MRNRRLQISIIGTRGIPGNYGGFETFAERLSCGLVAKGHRVSVYCPAAYNNHDHSDYRGVKRIVIPNIKSKSFDKISASIISSVHATISSRQIILFLGVSAVIFAWLPRLFGSKTVINIDGLEWRRKKWNKMASAYLKFSEALSGSICNRVVTDSIEIKKYFKRQYGKDSTYISYGADIRSYRDDAVLGKYGLEKEKYILQVCRLEPENNSDLIIREYCQVDTDVPLIILGDAPYSGEYKSHLKRLANPRVKFLGGVYGHDYEVIRSNPLCYVHGHEVGGTNPALLEAMAAGNCVAVLNVPYNLEVIAGAGVSFDKSEGSLKKRLVEILENPSLVSTLRNRASQRIKDNYTWEKIVNAYEDLFFRLAEE